MVPGLEDAAAADLKQVAEFVGAVGYFFRWDGCDVGGFCQVGCGSLGDVAEVGELVDETGGNTEDVKASAKVTDEEFITAPEVAEPMPYIVLIGQGFCDL